MNTGQAILFSILISSVSSDICDALGQCTESIYMTNEPAIDPFDCWKKCRTFDGCNFGTFIPDKTECSLFQTCTKLDTTSCPNCRTSSSQCIQCDFPGLCFGEDYLNYEPKSDKEACWSWCKSTKDCNWFSYETNGIQMCRLFENCLEIDEEHYPQYISGHKNCEYIYTKLLVTTGIYNKTYENGLHSEVIDINKKDAAFCELAAPLHLVEGAAGGLVKGKPMICGGFNEDPLNGGSNKCFILGETQPKNMAYERSYPASVSISKDKLWITGGYTSKFSTEIVTETEVRNGPTLDYGMYWHCSAHINDTHAILIGGNENGFTPYIFNLNTFDLFYGSKLPHKRKGCAATQIIHPNGTAFVIIVGPDNTSEILNTDDIFGQWVKGPELPQNCIDGSLVSSSNGQEAFLVGCAENPEKIYTLRWSSTLSLEWVLMTQKLKYPRSNTVAMLIPNALLTNCKIKTVKYLIVGGNIASTEVVELIKTDSTPSFGQLPVERIDAIGTMFGDAPILCGGYDNSALDSCISFQNSQWIQSHSMNSKRKDLGGVQINSTTFWLLGGRYYDIYKGWVILDSTEFIIEGQANGAPGPKLPHGMDSMCVVKLSEAEIFVIGGSGGDNHWNEVWIYDPQNGFTRNQGPSMNKQRHGHSCSIMRDGDKTVIVVAGGVDGKLEPIEIYDPTDNIWHLGPSLPYSLSNSAMAESPDGKGVLIFGGERILDNGDRIPEDKILELRAGANSWNTLDITLEDARKQHAVIPFPF